MAIRRLVTGHDHEGKSVFVSDAEVDPVRVDGFPGGAEFHRIWGADEPPRFPNEGLMPFFREYFPPLAGFRFGLFTVAPDTAADSEGIDLESAFKEMEEKLPGLLQHLEPMHPGMHTTATIDFEYVVSGRCQLELDDGVIRDLSPGDTIVQNGTRHAWRNPFNEPCLLVVFQLGVQHERVSGVS